MIFSESINLIIPEASAKVSLRLAPSQDPDEAMDLLGKHVKENSPWGVDVNFIPGAKGSGGLCSSEGEFIQTLLKEFSNSWGKECTTFHTSFWYNFRRDRFGN